jgi:rare lipoprotein A
MNGKRYTAHLVIPAMVFIFVVMSPGLAGCSSTYSQSYRATGLATWYGPKFHGKRTASGERFDMHELTAAHRSLPFGTNVKVTNLDNGKSVTVRINDRGPSGRGKIIDLSYEAAKKIGMADKGIVKVRVEAK